MQPTKSILIHFIFTPKYRRPIFSWGFLRAAAEDHMRYIARLKHIEIAELAIQPDHVHLMAYLPATLTIAEAAGVLKWYSSLKLRQDYPGTVNARHLWGKDYWCVSVGGGESQQREYIRQQMAAIRRN